MVMDYSQHQRVIDGTGRILDTTMSNPNVGSWVSEDQLKTWINTGMATDADLTAEVAQREAADTDLKNAIENTSIWDIDQEAEVTFEGDGAGTWEIMERQIPTENNDGIFLCMDSSAPSSSSSAGLKGQFYMDANYFYLCIADNTWRRVALSTF